MAGLSGGGEYRAMIVALTDSSRFGNVECRAMIVELTASGWSGGGGA